MQAYPPEIERAMKKYYATLSEKDQRRYAAVEAMKLGLGGQSYIAKVLGCSEKTVSRGLDDWNNCQKNPNMNPPYARRVAEESDTRSSMWILMSNFWMS